MAQIYGVDIGTDAIKIAVIEKRFNDHETVRYIRRLVDPANREVSFAQCATLLDESGFDKNEDHLVMLYPTNLMSFRALSTPMTSPKAISETLPYELEGVTPFLASALVARAQIVATTAKGADLFVAATTKDQFEAYLAQVRAAGLAPDALIPHPVTYFPSADSVGVIATIDLGLTRTVVTLCREGRPVGIHAIAAGIESLGDSAESDNYNTNAGLLARRIAAETRGLATTSLSPEGVIALAGATITLTGGGAAIDPLVRKIAALMGGVTGSGAGAIPKAKIDDDRRTFKSAAPELFVPAQKCAEDYAASGTKMPYNFLTGPYAIRRRFAGGKSDMIVTTALAALVVIAGIVSFVMDNARLTDRYENLRAQIRSEFSRAVPEVTTIVDESQQLKTALAELEERHAAMGGGTTFLDRLHDLSNAPDHDLVYDIDRFVFESGRIVMTGKTESFEKVETLRKAVATIPWVAKAVVSNATSSAASGGVTFSINIEASL